MSPDDDGCPFCWGTGQITVMEPATSVLVDARGILGAIDRAVIRPCPEGCLAPEEVPF